MRDPAALASRLLPLLLAAALAACPAGAQDRIEAQLLPAEPPLRPLPRWTAPGRPRLALALSGGGARGFAHVGVLDALDEEGIEIDGLSGTSAGALAGSFLAAGHGPEEIEDLLELGDWNQLFRGLDVRRQSLSRAEDLARSSTQLRLKRRRPPASERPPGLIASHALDRALQRVLLLAQGESGGDFDRLAIPFRPVATDLVTGAKVAPSSGPLATLVRGSAAVPGLMAPVPHGEMLLVDGGLRENVPVETALSLGPDLVVAVDVSQRLDNAYSLSTPVDVMDRSLDIVMDTKTRQSLEQAALVLRPDVDDASRSAIGDQLPALIAAGRAEVESRRDEIWRSLEAAAGSGEVLRVDDIDVRGSDRISTAVLRERLGLEEDDEVPRWRVASELARLLNRLPIESGHVDVVEESGRRLLRFVLVERDGPPSVRVEGLIGQASPSLPEASLLAARRAAWQLRRGLMESGDAYTHLAGFEWDGSVAVLSFSQPGVSRVSTEAPADPKLDWTNRRVSKLTGERFRYSRLTWRLDDLKTRGIIRDWRLRPERADDGSLTLTAELEPDRPDELAIGASYRDDLEWAGLVRLRRGNLSGRGDAVWLTAAAAEELTSFALRYGNPGGLGLRTVGYEIGIGWREGWTPTTGLDQRYLDEETDGYEARSAWLHLVHRAQLGSQLDFGLLYEHRRLPAAGGGPGDTHERTAASLRWSLDQQDRLLFPTDGGRILLRGDVTLAGDELWRLEARGSHAIALSTDRRTVLEPRAGFGVSDDADHRSFWFDPGGHRALYGYVPYGAAAPQYARAGLVLRHRLLSRGPVDIYLEAGGDALWTSSESSGLDELEDHHGYGLSLTANVHWLGPITVGWAANSDDTDVWFITAGFPFLDD